MQVSYTKDLEERLDLIESDHRDWRAMLGDFYGRFSSSLEHAHENLMHARAVTRPAPLPAQIHEPPAAEGRPPDTPPTTAKLRKRNSPWLRRERFAPSSFPQK